MIYLPTDAAWWLVTLYISMYLSVLVHEAGHYLAGRWLRMAVSHVDIGVGETCYSFRIKGVNVYLKQWPTRGHVVFVWLSKNHWKNITMFAAGPAANFIVGFWLIALRIAPDLGHVMLWIGAFNLCALKDSDGSHIKRQWKLWKAKNGKARKVPEPA